MATGNGAFIVHLLLSKYLSNYSVIGYHPYLTLIPPSLLFIRRKVNKADIIHTTPDYACFFKRPKTPLIITFHNYVLDDFMNVYSSIFQRLHYKTDLKFFIKKALKSATEITAVSKFLAKIIKKDMGYQGPIKIIYNGINIDKFHPPSTKYPQKKVRVLFSGNLTKRKGADILPLIAKLLNQNVEIYYTGGLRGGKNGFSSERLIPLGKIPYEKMHQIYQQADILLFPTVREGLPLAVLEAMACGLPVVASNCSSLPELIVDKKGGFLCEVGNAKDFAQKILLLAESPHLRKEMGEYNRARAEKYFDLRRMVKEYNELFLRVITKK